MALLIVVLVTAVVVSVSWRFQLSMYRNENRWHGAQARAYLEGAEQMMRKVLYEDLQETGPVDHLNEVWMQISGQEMATDEGGIRGTIEDAHGRFNLNLLADTPPVPGQNNPNANPNRNQDPWTSMTDNQRRVVRLLQTIELESGPVQYQTAMEIVDAIRDWLDPDDQVSGFGGAEADYYEDQEPPYPITNGPMTSVSELSLIKGMTPEIYQQLVPLVIAIPQSEGMNINTLKSGLFRMLNRKSQTLPLTPDEASRLEEERNQATEGFKNPDEFFNGIEARSLLGDAPEQEKSSLAVASRYFLLFGEVQIGDPPQATTQQGEEQQSPGQQNNVYRTTKTLLFRGEINGINHVHVVRRTDANF
jgi:general secretion pathway protein K